MQILPKVIFLVIALALSIAATTCSFYPTTQAATPQTSIQTPKEWPPMQFPFGLVAQLKTVMRTSGNVSYQLTVSVNGHFFQHMKLELLDKDGFCIASHEFWCEGTQVYTGNFACDPHTYMQAASWNLEKF